MAMEDGISRRHDYFVDVQLWPRTSKINTLQWLSNFSETELVFANRLLDGFTYYSSELVSHMFRGAFSNVSQYVVQNKSNYVSASLDWARFLGSVLIVRVTGEQPNDSDSGYMFCRISRDLLGISQDQIAAPEEALARFMQNPRQNIVFVDDFVGSGNQFIETWERLHQIGSSAFSFSSVASGLTAHNNIFYVPVICTGLGKRRIRKRAPMVRIVPAHWVGERNSVVSPQSIVWRDDMRLTGPAFIERKSLDAGIPDAGGGEGCWRGFSSLGLALGFEHGWPDATIPLFYFNKNGWKPLLRKDT